MLNNVIILVSLVVNSLSDSLGNEVEAASTKYGELKCTKPDIANANWEPDASEIGLYETYTLTCKDNFFMIQGDVVEIGVNSVFTCMPGEESAALSPETLPACSSMALEQVKREFASQVDANAKSKYEVEKEQIGCWEKSRTGEYDGGAGLSDCAGREVYNYLDIGCNTDQGDSIFVGYDSLMIFEVSLTALWGQDIVDDPLPALKIYMECIPAADKATVCMNVDQLPAVSSTKLFVKSYSVPIKDGSTKRDKRSMNIKQSNDIHYRLRCDEGYSFEQGIDDDTVYGYCTKAGTGDDEGNNEFFAYTTAASSDAISCYSKCPANPTSVDSFSGGSPVFGKLYLPSMRKGATFTVPKEGVECTAGHALAQDAAENYEITCEGADTTADANSGKLSCTSCPVCHATCPANPDNADKFISGEDPVFAQLEIAELVKGQEIALAADKVTCKVGHSLADGSPESYTITCSDVGDDPDVGLLSCGAECPKCYAECPADPDSADKFKSDEDPVFLQLEIAKMIKGQQTSLAADKVTCKVGHSLADGSPESYTITCSDVGDDPDVGLLSCGAECPRCYAMCPENPNKENFEDSAEIIIDQLTMSPLKKGQSYTLSKENVVCEADMGLADDAPGTYDLTCGEANADVDPNLGVLGCTSCPQCFAQCLANPTEEKLEIPEDNGVKSVKIAANMNLKQSIEVTKENIECKDNYAMSAGSPSTYEFRCGDSGMFTCADGQNGCPKCEGTCVWPDATEGEDGYDFRYVDEERREDTRADQAIPGVNHVEAYCKNDSYVVMGPRFLSCIEDSTMVFDITGYPNGTLPECQQESVCQAPATGGAGGSLDKTGNIAVGDVYTFTCKEGYMLDLETQEEHDTEENVVEIPCVEAASNETLVNTELKGFECYSGCKAIEGFELGSISPAITRSGGAPYSEGQSVTFSCRDGYELQDSSLGVQTCENGTIGKTGTPPTCVKEEKSTDGSANLVLPSILAVGLIILTQLL